MTDAVIPGVGMTRFGKFPESSIRTLAEDAVEAALGDAGIEPGDVEAVFFANAVAGLMSGQEMIRGQVALRHTGLLGAPLVNVENACASASSALNLAVSAVRSGAVEVALAVGAEKLTHEEKAKAFAAIGTAVDLLELEAVQRLTGNSGDSQQRSFFMDIYAANARAYMERSGATAEDFAAVVVKSHDHGALNPDAQFRERVSVEQVLAGRVIAEPLTLMMCSPIGDGAAAVVVCSAERAERLAADAVRVRASVLRSGRDREDGEPSAAELASRAAYEEAGVGPGDLDVVELHDAAAPAELTTYEELGLCGEGEGPALLRSGATRLGGTCVVNPSGGLLSKGHPIGATGCAQVVELVQQLRGRAGERQVESAQVALAENGGGFLTSDAAAMVVTILSN